MDVKKGTTTIGIVCKDGIILAADRRATAGTLIVDKKAPKIHKITDNSAVTIAGTVSDAQMLIKLLQAEMRLKSIRTERDVDTKEIANMLASLLYSSIRRLSMIPSIAHFLLAGHDNKGDHLFDLFPDGSISVIDDYSSSGSGSVIAYGVLEALFRKDLSIDEATRLAVRSINAALQRDIATGNGIDVVKVTKSGVEWVLEETIEAKVEIKK